MVFNFSGAFYSIVVPFRLNYSTSDVLNQINAFTPVYIVIVIHNVIWERMRISINVQL